MARFVPYQDPGAYRAFVGDASVHPELSDDGQWTYCRSRRRWWAFQALGIIVSLDSSNEASASASSSMGQALIERLLMNRLWPGNPRGQDCPFPSSENAPCAHRAVAEEIVRHGIERSRSSEPLDGGHCCDSGCPNAKGGH